MYLERLAGRKSKALEDLVEEPLVIALKNGRVYGGRLGEYYHDGGGVIVLYSCSLLDQRRHKWVKLDADQELRLADIGGIFLLPRARKGSKLELDDVLHIHIDPYYKPLASIKCDWSLGEKGHRPECDAPLHEALAFLKTAHREFFSGTANKDQNRRRSEEAFAHVRRRLLNYGARIP
jgi:hypothetical protein